jgi:1,4-dihydroxy-2-naphthoate octaprenyltransferase
MIPHSVAVWLAASRPRTWPASLVPVAVGTAVAGAGQVEAVVAALTLLAALAMQVAANLANDYADTESGIDAAGRLGPARVTQSGELTAAAVRRAAWCCLGVALAAGAPLVVRGGAAIVAIGVASLACALAYSAGPWPLASRGLGELLAFVFFGIVAVAGTTYLQIGTWPATAALAGAAVGSYAAAIMLVNNLRDIPTDGPAGKRTLAVRIGETWARRLYLALLAASFVWVVLVAVAEHEPAPVLAVGALPLAWRESRVLATRSGAALNASLAGTVRLELVFGLLLACGLWIR